MTSFIKFHFSFCFENGFDKVKNNSLEMKNSLEFTKNKETSINNHLINSLNTKEDEIKQETNNQNTLRNQTEYVNKNEEIRLRDLNLSGINTHNNNDGMANNNEENTQEFMSRKRENTSNLNLYYDKGNK